MRLPTIVGIALVATGVFLTFGGGSFASRRAARSGNGPPVLTQEKHPLKPWMAGGALIVGLVIVFSSVRTGTHTADGARRR